MTSSKDKIKSSHNLKGFYWNITKKEIDENCIIGVQTIIHLAGASIVKRWTKKYKQEILDSRVQSAKLLQNLLQSTNNTVNHFITASGTAIYPESFNEVFDENCIQKDNSFLSNVIQQWENVAYEIQKTGIEITIVPVSYTHLYSFTHLYRVATLFLLSLEIFLTNSAFPELSKIGFIISKRF